MKSLVRIDERAEAINETLVETKGLLDPRQEAELHEIENDIELAIAVLFSTTMMAERLDALEEHVKKHRKEQEFLRDWWRARISKAMGTLAVTKASDPEKYVNVSFVSSITAKGRIELAPGCTIEDVDPMFVKVKTEKSLDTEACRAEIEGGGKVAGVVLKREDGIRMTKTARGKELAVIQEVAAFLGAK